MNNTLITQDRLDELVRLCRLTPFKKYAIAEVGVFKGGSLKLLAQEFNRTPCFGFDTFEGLPSDKYYAELELHTPGQFNETNAEEVNRFIDMPNTMLVKGNFPDDLPICFYDIHFAFVHLDADYFLSTKRALEFFGPRMVDNGIIVLDDFEWPNCPGIKMALEEFRKSYKRTNAEYQAYIQF